MSHQPERKEKDCLNCGATVQGRFCQVCGQENIVTKQNFWALAVHFVYDIFHFDGKFFDTLKHLLFRPGYVPKEYMAGKRQKYLDPIRMYLFTSAVFFIIFFAVKSPVTVFGQHYLNRSQRLELGGELASRFRQNPDDTVLYRHLKLVLDADYHVWMDTVYQAGPSQDIISYKGLPVKLTATPVRPPDAEEDAGSGNWFTKAWNRKFDEFRQQDNPEESFRRFFEKLFHNSPYLLFLSLPFFAAVLKLLYKRKKVFYSDHAIFTLYHYIFSFILLLFIFLFNGVGSWTGWRLWQLFSVLLFISWPCYLLVAMKRFYAQGWGKTVVKFVLLNFLGLLTFLILGLVLLLFSIFQF